MPLDYHVALPKAAAIKFSPDGTRCAVAGDSGTLLIDPRTGRVVQTLWPGHWPAEYAFSPDGHTLAARLDWIASVAIARWDGEDFLETNYWQSEDDAWGLGFSPRGDYLIIGTRLGFDVLDPETGRVEFCYEPEREERVCGLDSTPARDLWVSAEHRQRTKKVGGTDAILRLWRWPFSEATCETLPYRLPHFHQLSLHPDGDLLAVLFGSTEARAVLLQVYSLGRRMILHAQPATAEPSCILQWSHCGRYLATSTHRGAAVGVIDFETRSLAAEFALGEIDGPTLSEWPYHVDFSPDSTLLAIASTHGGIVKLPQAQREPARAKPRR